MRPGQFVNIRGRILRVKKRAPENTLSCSGCILNNYISCPNVMFANDKEAYNPLPCCDEGYIFVKP